tara:strand:+ start:328 stop:600 length:273 start_codon:yes stop_codon:yes gene_type:complete
MAKKEKVKAEKPSKISNEHLNTVQGVINNITQNKLEIGSIEIQKHHLLHSINVHQEQLQTLQKQLEEEYGTSDINVQTGEINYEKNEQAD